MRSIIIPENYKYIAVFLTMRCNLNCSFCLNSIDKSRDFNRLKFKEIGGQEWVNSLNRIQTRPDIPITFCGGEPFLHKDFLHILTYLKPELSIDILTNLNWGESNIQKFVREIDPERIKRNAPYPPIRVSYHPEQMGDGESLIKNVKLLQEAGFSIGIESVMYPHPSQIEAIEQMAIKCRNNGISFRPKSFTGVYEGRDDIGRSFSILHGNYSKYPGCTLNSELKSCLCKTSEFILGPDGNVYRCHRDLFSEEFPIGNISDPNFELQDAFRQCNKYGQCHPCDVKVKTNSKQELGHTSVEIKDIQ